MAYSDQWVSEGRVLTSPLLDAERAALVRSYAGLLAAIHRPDQDTPQEVSTLLPEGASTYHCAPNAFTPWP